MSGPAFRHQPQAGNNAAVRAEGDCLRPRPGANAGLGCAIPSNDAEFVFQHIGGKPDGEGLARLGAKVQEVTPNMAEALGEPGLRRGMVVWARPDEPARKAGLLAADVTVRYDVETFSDERALLRGITMRKPGEQVSFGIWRNGREIELKVMDHPEDRRRPAVTAAAKPGVRPLAKATRLGACVHRSPHT